VGGAGGKVGVGLALSIIYLTNVWRYSTQLTSAKVVTQTATQFFIYT